MANQTFRDAYEAAASELETLVQEQERIEERILSLRKTMNALATLISQHEGKDKDFLDYAAAKLRDLIDVSLTGDIHRVVAMSPEPLTATEIREQLKELGGSLAEHSNPLATIYAILARLQEAGKIKETLKNGKKAWERYKSLSERLGISGNSPNPAISLQAIIHNQPDELPQDPTKMPPVVSKGTFINYDKSPAPPVRKK